MTETGTTRPSGDQRRDASRVFLDHSQDADRLRARLYVLDQWLATCTGRTLNEWDSECVHILVSDAADLAGHVSEAANECEGAYNGLWCSLEGWGNPIHGPCS